MTTLPQTYKRTRTIYVIGDVAFVANPATRSSWWKTHASVAVAACPTCKAQVGQLCVPSFGFCRGSTHEERRSLLPQGEARAEKVITRDEQARDDYADQLRTQSGKEPIADEPWAWAVHDDTGSLPCDEGGTCDYTVEYNKEEATAAASRHRDRLWDEQHFPTEEQCDKAVTVMPLYPRALHYRASADQTTLTEKLAEVEADRDAKAKRISELNAAMVKLSNALPYPEEIRNWTEQRSSLVAEIGSLRSKLAEGERELLPLRQLHAESRDYVITLEQERDFYVAAQHRLAAEVERLTSCLVTANANHAKFERQWYLAVDETEALRAAAAENGRLADRLREQRDGLAVKVERLKSVIDE